MFRTVTPSEIKGENRLDVIQNVAQEKATASTHSMNDVIAFIILMLMKYQDFSFL